jgi:hypothetical protein
MAKKDVVRLLVRLFGDPALHAKMSKDAGKVLASAKLSPKERELVLSGDAEAIRAYLGDDTVKTNVVKTGLKGITNVVKTAIHHKKRPTKKKR